MLNYKHLHYFWVVAQEGSMTRAAERLGVAVQTISGQLSLLERQLGKALFNSQGRGLVLSEAGRVALGYADQIFQLGEALTEAVHESGNESTLRLRAGISDGIPKLLAYRLLSKVMEMSADVRLICDEDEFEDLLADLALHKLDVVLTDRPAPIGGNLKVFSSRLGDFATGLFGPAQLIEQHSGPFPESLNGAPMLLPTRHNALRGQIDRWLEAHQLRPRIVGEFEDSALLKTFGAGGMGVFPAAELVSDLLPSRYGVRQVGRSDEVAEHFYAIAAEKKVAHPLVQRLLPAA